MAGLATRLRSLLPFGSHRVATLFVALDRSRCKACWRCVAACPESAIGKVEMGSHRHAVIVGGDRCTGCGACVKACTSQALATRAVAS